MIDTVKLMVNFPDFEITQPELFYPDSTQLLELQRTFSSAIQRPSKADHRLGLYKPSLKLVRRPVEGGGISIFLLIEFSAPKLLFGNNFEECNHSDFPLLVIRLAQVLRAMGVFIAPNTLANAKVLTIHYGKNYVLKDFSLPYTFMEEMSRANISRVYDVNQADFRNQGHSWKFRTNTFEFTLYDKVKDLEKASISYKRSLEGNQNGQLPLLKPLRRLRKDEPFEVIRLELRFSNTRSIKKLLEDIQEPLELTFKLLFSRNIAQKACLHHLKKVREAILLTNTREQNSFTDYLSELIRLNPTVKPRLLFAYAAYKEVIKEKGEQVARLLIDPKNNGGWYRYRKEFSTLNEPKSLFKIDKLIEMTEEFRTVKLADYSQNLLIDVN